jgi:uncharacterized membrane protein (Fun14 family)
MRSITIGLSAGVVAFAGIDFALFMLAVWLVPSPAASAFVAEFLLTFAPTVLAGLVAGYLAAPRGFVVAFLAGLTGAAISLSWHYGLISIEHALLDRVSATTMFSWVAGTALVCGVCGIAGEHLHANASVRPNKSLERTREG